MTVDTNEMQDIKWVHRDEVREALASNEGSVAIEPGLESESLTLPGKSSLARRLIAAWAEGEVVWQGGEDESAP